MFHTIYKVTHLPTGRYYIGAHSTDDLNDGYMGSGIRIERAIKKYGIDSFKKEIIFHAFTVEDLYLVEKELVTLSPESFNLVPGGGRPPVGVHTIPHTEETKRIISDKKKAFFKTNPHPRGMSGKKQSQEHIESARNLFKTNNPMMKEANRKAASERMRAYNMRKRANG